jgi:prolyl-tRNA editing enzyme YbaK/EbsC (Cys-tRNA(Pro) deacylase)
LVSATRQVDVNRTVRRWLGVRKASFAPPEEVVALTGMTPHGVTPFGLPESVAVLVDAALTELPEVVVGGGSRRLKIALAPAALTALPGASVVDGLSRELPPDDAAR